MVFRCVATKAGTHRSKELDLMPAITSHEAPTLCETYRACMDWMHIYIRFDLIFHQIFITHTVRVKYAQSRGCNREKKRELNVVGKCTLEGKIIKLLC